MKKELKFDELGNVFEMGFDDVRTIHGKDGKDGQDGYTPIKGVDYYTEAEKKELVTEVAEDVKGEVYNKSETDKKLDTKANKTSVYTISEINGFLYGADSRFKEDEADILRLEAEKADKKDVYTKEYINEAIAGADARFGEVEGKHESDISRLEAEISNKADKATTYTITQTDTRLSTKADKADLDSINSLINKNFELIATQTVSPDTDGNLPNAIEFDLDSDSDSDSDNELTDFYLYVNTKITAASAVRLYTNGVTLWGNATIPGLYNANSTVYRHWYIQYLSFGENKGGIISAPSQAIANSGENVRQPQGNLYTDYIVIVPHTSVLDKVSAINNIKKIKLSLVNTANNSAFAEGSTFELWGVKKK